VLADRAGGGGRDRWWWAAIAGNDDPVIMLGDSKDDLPSAATQTRRMYNDHGRLTSTTTTTGAGPLPGYLVTRSRGSSPPRRGDLGEPEIAGPGDTNPRRPRDFLTALSCFPSSRRGTDL